MTYDVLVAGAGPAGAATAAALVRRGFAPRQILVVDRARFPREKPCGGGLTGHALDAMQALGLTLDVPHVSSPRARVVCGAQSQVVGLPRPVEIIRRDEFDASLVAQVQSLGVRVRQGCGLREFAVVGDAVEAQTDDGSVRARVLVGADGAGSLVRKRLRAGRRAPRPIRLFRAELPMPDAIGDPECMIYDFTPMRPHAGAGLRGYLWVFPAPGGRVNVGLMHDPGRSRSGAELVTLLRRDLAARHGLALADEAAGWPAWGYEPRAPVSAPHVLLVGDAAGIDALTGEGIAVGFEHAFVAASVVAAAFDRGRFELRGYRRALRRATVGRELFLDRWLARLLYRGRTERWLGLVLGDPRMLELYAARVSGTIVLADHKRALLSALGRHLWKGKPICWS